MNFAWVAALLAPRDMLPHPNFSTFDQVTPASYFAAIVHSRISFLPPAAQDIEGYSGRLSPIEQELVTSAARALRLGTSREGGQELEDLSRRVLADDQGMAVAAALLATLALSELDEIEQCLELLQDILGALGTPRRSDTVLLYVILQVQSLMRAEQAGLGAVDDDAHIDQLLKSLDAIGISELPEFKVGQGVAWTYHETYERIVADLRFVLIRRQAQRSPAIDEWTAKSLKELVPSLITEASGGENGGLESFIQERFDELVLSSEITWRNEDPVDAPVWRSLVHFELSGNADYARSGRRTLGQLRLLRLDKSSYETVQDGLQLLRHSAQSKPYGKALEYVRANGPIDALRAEVRQVVGRRLLKDLPLFEADLRCISAAGQLLPPTEASLALERLISLPGVETVQPYGSYQYWGARLALVFDAGLSLASAAQEFSVFARYLLTRIPAEDEQFVVQALARTVSRIEWSRVDADVRSEWIHWLQQNDSKQELLRDATESALGISSNHVRGELNTISSVATAIDAVNGGYYTMRAEDRSRALDVTVGALDGLAREAHSGMFSGGGFSIPDVAAGLGLYARVGDVWPKLLEILLDPSVSRTDKAPALRRIARTPAAVPPEASAALASGIRELLGQQGPDSFLATSTTDPFPEALAVAAALGLIPDHELMFHFSRLTGSSMLADRVDGSRWLEVVARRNYMPVPTWVNALALQASYDVDANVRAYAGRTLCASLEGSSPELGIVLLERVAALLNQDGIVGPLLVLKALGEYPGRLPNSLIPQLEEIAQSHAAIGVRLQAAALLRRSDEE